MLDKAGGYLQVQQDNQVFQNSGQEDAKERGSWEPEAYLEENWDGDLMDILCASLKKFALLYAAYLDNKSLERYKFFETITSCHRNCSQCSYCEELVKNVVKFRVISRGKLEDVGLKDMTMSNLTV